VPGIRETRNYLVVPRNKDLEIANRVRDALSLDPATRSWAIAISVINGVVFFSGAAQSEDERNRATELAMGVSGVRQVSNGLLVRPATRTTRFPPPRIPPRPTTYNRKR
jgi:osmotically-inducible protein OsmY